MAIDFSKLRDPAYIAEQAQRRAVKEAEQLAMERKCDDAIQLCEGHHEALSPKEAEFLRSLKRSVGQFRTPATPKQLTWLFDIVERFEGSEPPTVAQADKMPRTSRSQRYSGPTGA